MWRFQGVARALVLEILAAELVEETHRVDHRANAAHLGHRPLQRVVARGGALRQRLPGPAGQVNREGARFGQRKRPAAGAVRIEDGRDLVVRVERRELGRRLVPASKLTRCASCGRPVSSRLIKVFVPLGVVSDQSCRRFGCRARHLRVIGKSESAVMRGNDGQRAVGRRVQGGRRALGPSHCPLPARVALGVQELPALLRSGPAGGRL